MQEKDKGANTRNEKSSNSGWKENPETQSRISQRMRAPLLPQEGDVNVDLTEGKAGGEGGEEIDIKEKQWH